MKLVLSLFKAIFILITDLSLHVEGLIIAKGCKIIA